MTIDKETSTPMPTPSSFVPPLPVNKNLKVVTLTAENGRLWTVAFQGTINHKDVKKFDRLIRVGFARITRQRSVDNLIKKREQQKLEEQNNDSNR